MKVKQITMQGMTESEKRMSRAAKGHEKYGKAGMAALAKAGRDGASDEQLDKIRDKHDKYDEGIKSWGDVGDDHPHDDDSVEPHARHPRTWKTGKRPGLYNKDSGEVKSWDDRDDDERAKDWDSMIEVGEDIAGMTGSSAKVIANDGKTITVAMPDGTQIQKPIGPNMLATDPQGKPIVNLNPQQGQAPTPTQQNPQDMFAKGKDITVNTGTPVEEEQVSEGSAHGYNVVRWYRKNRNSSKITAWLKKEAGLPKETKLYFDDADLVLGSDTIVPEALVDDTLKFNDLLTALVQATGGTAKQKTDGVYRESVELAAIRRLSGL